MTLIAELMALYAEKNTCFERLLVILEKEGDVLKTGNVAPLWSMAEEKQAVAGGIMAIRERIVRAMEQAGRSLDMATGTFRTDLLIQRLSHAEAADLEPYVLRTAALKQQVRAAADANLGYLRLCLDVVGEMMAVFMRPAQAAGYDRNRRMPGAGNAYVNRRV